MGVGYGTCSHRWLSVVGLIPEDKQEGTRVQYGKSAKDSRAFFFFFFFLFLWGDDEIVQPPNLF